MPEKNSDRSRIMRETLWVINNVRDHLDELIGLPDNKSVHITHVIALMGMYMLKEEGLEDVTPQQLIDECGMQRSSAYNSASWLADKGVVDVKYGRYTCLSKTPHFLVNPEELYLMPIKTVGDKNYSFENALSVAIGEFSKEIPRLIKEEYDRHDAQGNTAGNGNKTAVGR